MTRVMVTGANGQVGWEVVRVLHPFVQVVAVDRQTLDLGRPECVEGVVASIGPDLIINCAAYTAVDRAEQEPALAQRINADSVHELGEAARRSATPIVHLSTDYVFAGDASVPYTETDDTAPLSVYGKSKLAGERALGASGAQHWIFRTSWVFAARGRNFVKAILARAAESGALRVVDDQRGSPTWARTIAEVIGALIIPHATDRHSLAQRVGETAGTYHLTSSGDTTWYEFARFVIDRLGGAGVTLTAIRTADYPTAAQRPVYAVLDTSKLRSVFAIDLPAWTIAATLCLADMAGGAKPALGFPRPTGS